MAAKIGHMNEISKKGGIKRGQHAGTTNERHLSSYGTVKIMNCRPYT
jgi:hypothetical protein